MSCVFDAVLCPRNADTILTHLPSVPNIEIRTLEPNISVLLTVENVRDFSQDLASLASSLSLTFEKTLYIQYADNVGWRYSALFVKGMVVASFGEDDERWILIDENGEPISEPMSVNELDALDPEEEYKTIQNAIELGLAAFGAGDWQKLMDLILVDLDQD